MARLELATSGLEVLRAIQLRHIGDHALRRDRTSDLTVNSRTL